MPTRGCVLVRALIALCALQSLLMPSARGMNCELYNRETIEQLFERGLEACHPGIQDVNVFEYYINCLSFGELRGTFSFTTVTVVFNSSIHPGEEIAYYDIGCTETNIWDITPITPFQGLEIGNGRRQNDTRMDCAACATPRVIPSFTSGVVFDNATHCYGRLHRYYNYT